MSIKLLIAFGSRVTGRATSSSDFDFGVLADGALSLADRTDISGRLAKKFSVNEDKIDLVDLYTANPMIKFEVARNGKLVEGATFDFIRFKVRAMKEFQDTAKFRRMRERVMLQAHV
jgi:predicted nucleotidyltransferase